MDVSFLIQDLEDYLLVTFLKWRKNMEEVQVKGKNVEEEKLVEFLLVVFVE